MKRQGGAPAIFPCCRRAAGQRRGVCCAAPRTCWEACHIKRYREAAKGPELITTAKQGNARKGTLQSLDARAGLPPQLRHRGVLLPKAIASGVLSNSRLAPKSAPTFFLCCDIFPSGKPPSSCWVACCPSLELSIIVYVRACFCASSAFGCRAVPPTVLVMRRVPENWHPSHGSHLGRRRAPQYIRQPLDQPGHKHQ